MELPQRAGQRHDAFLLDGVGGVVVLDIENSDFLFKVFHDTYSVCIAYAGVSEWKYRGVDHMTGAEECMLMQPGETHTTKRLRVPGTYAVFMLDPSVVEHAARERGVRSPDLRIANTADPGIFAPFDHLFRRATDASSTLLERQEAFARAMDALLECAGDPPPLPREADRVTVRPAIDYLVEHIACDVSLTDLAAAVGRSPGHVARSFRRYAGISPHRFLMRMRATRARALLDRGQSAKQASHAVGFSSPAQLTRWFTATYGLTPSAYALGIRRR